jgi:hypothetical protein
MSSTADTDIVDPDTGKGTKNTAAGVDFSEVYSLLTKHQQSSNSLVLPLNDPAFNRILDLLTVQGIERLANKRWEHMARKIQSSTPTINATNEQSEDDEKEEEAEESEETKWLALQRASYKKYEVEGDNDERDDESNRLPNHLTPERFDRLRNVGVAMNKWEMRLMELKRYYEERGDCEVPIQYPGVRLYIRF